MSPSGYTIEMDRRLTVWIMLLSLAWQGPALAYSASLTNPVSSASGMIQCVGDPLPKGSGCEGCCSHNSGSCASACALSLDAVVPTSLEPLVVTVPCVPVPHADRPALVEHHPARLLRPPIV